MARYLVLVVAVLVLVAWYFSGMVLGPANDEAPGKIRLITLDPGHFHAALVQKSMYDSVSPTVHVYAPEGLDVEEHLKRIQGFNTREDDPTSWQQTVHKGDDYLERMLADRAGNVVVVAGNNKKKTAYLKAAVDAGLNVLSDKPMCIDAAGWDLLRQAFDSARQSGVLLYDIMTERYEITSILQKELAHLPDLFGQMQVGTPEDPAITKESVHHLFKYVAGQPLKRPAWYFDVRQQGEGIVDVATHLVDLVMWGAFPEEVIDYERDIRMISARHWPTMVTRRQYERVTGLSEFPDYLRGGVDDQGVLSYYCNGEMIYTLRGVHSKVSVIWDYEAPEGGGDTHYSIMRGSKANIIIQQGREENYKPELYVEPAGGTSPEQLAATLETAIVGLNEKYPGLGLEAKGNRWRVTVPDRYRVGHEAHFAQVTKKFLQYLGEGRLPDWEVPNMIAKYFVTTQALRMAAGE
jgi:predicted dehydrogenase